MNSEHENCIKSVHFVSRLCILILHCSTLLSSCQWIWDLNLSGFWNFLVGVPWTPGYFLVGEGATYRNILLKNLWGWLRQKGKLLKKKKGFERFTKPALSTSGKWTRTSTSAILQHPQKQSWRVDTNPNKIQIRTGYKSNTYMCQYTSEHDSNRNCMFANVDTDPNIIQSNKQQTHRNPATATEI